MRTLAEIWDEIGTLDLFLSSGNSAFAKQIKEATGCKWSHASVAVRSEDTGIYCWEATGKGCGLVDLEDSVVTPDVTPLDKATNWGAGEIGWRRLEGELTQAHKDRMWEFIRANQGKPYEQNKLQMLRAIPWLSRLIGANDEDLSSMFCWEASVALPQYVGVFRTDAPANSFPNYELAYADDLALPGFRYLPLEEIKS